MNLRIISWNIAGGHPINSLDHLDYSPEDLNYFIEQVRALNPDIICLQESHTPKEDGVSNASQIAQALNMPHVFNSPASISHVDPKHQLSTAIVSNIPFQDTKSAFFPNPDTQLFWKDGRPADTHEKNMQVVDSGEFAVANNQMLPLTLFGYDYQDETYGGLLAKGINEVMEKTIPQKPLIWCGDFNFADPLAIYPHMRTCRLTDALPDEATRPSKDGSKKRPDHIFFTPEFKVENADIQKTNSDHYLCFADFSFGMKNLDELRHATLVASAGASTRLAGSKLSDEEVEQISKSSEQK